MFRIKVTRIWKNAGIEAFAKEMGVDFYPAGRGIGHQIMCEEGYAFPSGMMVAPDNHAQYEIRVYSDAMAESVKAVAPFAWEA